MSCAYIGHLQLFLWKVLFQWNETKRFDAENAAKMPWHIFTLSWEALFQSLHQDVAIVSLPLGFIMRTEHGVSTAKNAKG